MSESSKNIEQAFNLARQQYADWGVDVDRAMQRLSAIAVSLHCWQGDDVGGFENAGEELGGGLAVTGNYPGKARTADELRADLDMALSLLPGTHRLNLHACYAETGGKRVDRNEMRPGAFQELDRLGESRRASGMDFNPTFFSHPKAADGFTLAHPDAGIRRFWIEHGIACRRDRRGHRQAALKSPCVTNVWIPDGIEGHARGPQGPAACAWPNRWTRFSPSRSIRSYNLDAVEGKLFGIGSESYVVGSHEFYLGYAVREPQTAVPGRRPFPSHRESSSDKTILGSACCSTRSCCTSAAASAGTATTW